MDKIRVLVADDHFLFREGLRRILADEEDIECIGIAEDGQAAVDLAKQLTPDVVTMDVAMPKMTGEKLVNQMRQIRPDIPAILCTGYSDKVDKKTATLLGCEYVIKPVERDQLAQLIRKTLDKP